MPLLKHVIYVVKRHSVIKAANQFKTAVFGQLMRTCTKFAWTNLYEHFHFVSVAKEEKGKKGEKEEQMNLVKHVHLFL